MNRSVKTVNRFEKKMNRFYRTVDRFQKIMNRFYRSVDRFRKTMNRLNKTVHRFHQTVQAFEAGMNRFSETVHVFGRRRRLFRLISPAFSAGIAESAKRTAPLAAPRAGFPEWVHAQGPRITPRHQSIAGKAANPAPFQKAMTPAAKETTACKE